jgi:hypothetical protein
MGTQLPYQPGISTTIVDILPGEDLEYAGDAGADHADG